MKVINVKNFIYNEIDNVYRVQNIDPFILQELKNKHYTNLSVCMFTITKDYIQGSIEAADIIYVAKDAEEKISGFVCLEYQLEENNLYLSLLCSCKPGVGAYLLTQYVIPLAKKMEVFGIILHAVPHKISYYKKYGFEIGQACYGDDFSGLTKQFQKKFESTDEMYDDLAMFDSFQTLSRFDLLVNSDTEECKKEKFILDKNMTKAERLGCLFNGVYMYLCLRGNIFLPPLRQPVVVKPVLGTQRRKTPRLKRHPKINRPTVPTRLVARQ